MLENRLPLLRRPGAAGRVNRAGLTLFRLALMVGLSFIIVFPFLAKISSMFMSFDDLRDPIVWLVPRSPTLDNIKNVLKYGRYWEALRNSFLVSLCGTLLQVASCAATGYGLARFRFRGKAVVIALVALTIVIPPQTIYLSLYTKFRFFDVFGLFGALGLPALNLVESLAPTVMLSLTAVGLKNGLYILVLYQFFRSVPKELSEAACVDGAGVPTTFLRVILPQARPMMVSVFLLSFAWQWTDTFYSGLFYRKMPILPNVVSRVQHISELGIAKGDVMSATMVNTAVILIILPLVLLYLFGQRYLIQGVERSGLVG